jgi:hypothetical protein
LKNKIYQNNQAKQDDCFLDNDYISDMGSAVVASDFLIDVLEQEQKNTSAPEILPSAGANVSQTETLPKSKVSNDLTESDCMNILYDFGNEIQHEVNQIAIGIGEQLMTSSMSKEKLFVAALTPSWNFETGNSTRKNVHLELNCLRAYCIP